MPISVLDPLKCSIPQILHTNPVTKFCIRNEEKGF